MTVYNGMLYGGLVAFIITLFVTTVLFIRNDVAKIIGDLTGFNAKRAMHKMKKQKKKAKIKEEERREKQLQEVIDKEEKNIDIVVPKKMEEPKDVDKSAVRFFQMEEDVTVLGGKVQEESADISEESGGLTTVLSSEEYATIMKQKNQRGGTEEREVTATLKQSDVNGVLEDDETSVLVDDATSVLVDDETSVLVDDATSVLVDDETSVLVDDATSVLVDDETSVLVDDATSVLVDDATSVLKEEKTCP